LNLQATEKKNGLEFKALTVANKVAGWLPFVRKLLDESAQKYSRVARTYYEDGNVAKAIGYYERALARAPTNVDILNDLAQLCYENQRLEEAEIFYKRALEEDYFNRRALKGLGFSLHWRGDIDEALYTYLRYLDLNGKDYDVLLNLSALFLDSGDDEKAIEFSQRAADADPTKGPPHLNLASAHFNLGNFHEAELSARKAIELERNEDSLRLLGLVLETLGKTQEALAVYVEASTINPTDPYTYLDLARLLNKLGRYSEYLENALKAVELFKDHPDNVGRAGAYWDLGWAYYNLGQWEKSAEASAKALEVDPALASPRFNLGLALLHIGKPDKAKKEYLVGIKNSKLVDLKADAIDDLEAALKKNPQLKGGQEILDILMAESKKLEKQRTIRSTQT
jgi:tetratricopeptide (TPR) repeat protein